MSGLSVLLRLSWAFATLALLGITAPVHAQNHTRPLALITVNGEATIDVAPDFAEINVGFVTQAKSAREAAEANAKGMTTLVGVLKEQGLDAKDIQTARYSVQPLYSQQQPGRNEPPRIVGYQVSNRVQATVRDLTKIGDILDRLVAAGANNISGPTFLVSNPSKAADAAREAAIADAKRKAELYVKASGVQLGRVYSIAEQGVVSEPFKMRAGVGAAPTPIAPGQNTLRVNVTVSFELIR